VGYRSDRILRCLGLRRLPYLWTGTLLHVRRPGHHAFRPAVACQTPRQTRLWIGRLGMTLAFMLVGAGPASHTDRRHGAGHRRWPPTTSAPAWWPCMHAMLLLGMVASSAGATASSSTIFRPRRLVQVIQGSAVVVRWCSTWCRCGSRRRAQPRRAPRRPGWLLAQPRAPAGTAAHGAILMDRGAGDLRAVACRTS
jgi:BCD family chlorophyll transporter-like MFS transporter